MNMEKHADQFGFCDRKTDSYSERRQGIMSETREENHRTNLWSNYISTSSECNLEVEEIVGDPLELPGVTVYVQ